MKKSLLNEIKSIAETEAIETFAKNLQNLLLSPPAGEIRTLAADPAFRTGCKLAVLDEYGNLLSHSTIYPNAPHHKTEESRNTILKMIQKFKIQAIVIGNGTAGRETYAFFKEFISPEIIITMVDESGASIYSASPAGIEEFPDHDITVRGSISIGRRFQDPLSELVKIDPKSIGVGQYQHDVNQKELRSKLDQVVTSVVNRIGVDLNTASKHILKYIAGISTQIAENIVNYRKKHGAFQTRDELLKVEGFGKKAFLQASGFLIIRNGSNPLDSTRIHPESYLIVKEISLKLKTSVSDLLYNDKLLKKINHGELVTNRFKLPTITDIIHELRYPAGDYRKNFEVTRFKEGIKEISDLKEGMILNGIVTNVTDFGAFVDIGVHQDGLVHKSELSNKFISDPHRVISLADKVKVKIISLDLNLNRIGLSIKQADLTS
jgi:uncharacterized protein